MFCYSVPPLTHIAEKWDSDSGELTSLIVESLSDTKKFLVKCFTLQGTKNNITVQFILDLCKYDNLPLAIIYSLLD